MDFLIVDDDKTFRDATRLLIEDEGHYAQPAANGEAALAMLKEDKFDAVLLDVNLGPENGLDVLNQLIKVQPNLPVVMFTAQGTIKTAVEAMRIGALDFLEKPFTREQMHTVIARLKRFSVMNENIQRLEEEVNETKLQNPELLLDFASPGMRQIMEILQRAARTPASILITGESGTGKSVLARAVHEQSHLADKPFVTVSCPSLSKELLESELFGHVKGAFTGAVKDHWGKVKAAGGGTLFLDEIGDLPMEIQPKLLRLLQEREYERLGENITRQAELRIIAATNRDLKKRMTEGAFREDLYFRLNVIAVEMPPLRTRHDDMLRFAEHYLKYFSKQCARPMPKISGPAATHMLAYTWPGNLRELRNAIERAVILAKGDELCAEDLPGDLDGDSNHRDADLQPGALISLERLEELHMRKVLERTSTVTEAAHILGIDQATIYRKRKKLGMS
ncbi:MAG TPA: sigma-54 dependent transcriptional regulator [Verrucomicrobiae bacterium]|jgi:NtrC-family two-component system response regulator AlgB|nr:sigma-54 dependent transcriptional regulator [Verrucomicrobiae bacterium]